MDDTWRGGRARTFAALFVGYAGYFLGRAALPAATPFILAEYAALGVDKALIGWVATAGTVAYMLGKLVNGPLADRVGGRAYFVAGMAGSALLTALFAATGVSAFGYTGVGLFALAWSLNQFVLSAGWGSLLQVVSRRFPPSSHAGVMGLLSMSFLLGNAAALLYYGGLERLGLGWRGMVLVAAGSLLALAVGCGLALWREPPVFAREPRAADQSGVVAQLARTPAFWGVCALSGGMTLLRTAFNTWSPTFLNEAAGMAAGNAILGGAVFPIVGAVSTAVAGYASDRWRGRRGPVITVALVGLTLTLATMAAAPLAGNAPLALALVACAAFFLTGPYSFCAGVLALDLGGKRGSATAAGLIDAAGYLCATASGVGVGTVAEAHGWPAVFALLAGVAALTALAGLVYALFAEGRGNGSNPGPAGPDGV